MGLFDQKTVQCLNKKDRLDSPELFQGLNGKYYISILSLQQEPFSQSAVQTLSTASSHPGLTWGAYLTLDTGVAYDRLQRMEKKWLTRKKWNLSINSFQNKGRNLIPIICLLEPRPWLDLCLNHLTRSSDELSVHLSPPTWDTPPSHCSAFERISCEDVNYHVLFCTWFSQVYNEKFDMNIPLRDKVLLAIFLLHFFFFFCLPSNLNKSQHVSQGQRDLMWW